MHGCHAVAQWSSTQSTVAASSAEAELNAIGKAAAETIGMLDMARDCGIQLGAAILTDSSAANSISHKRGCGKLKHLENRQLWVQEKILSKRLDCRKIARAANPSDAFTHHWSPLEGSRHFPNIGLVIFNV